MKKLLVLALMLSNLVAFSTTNVQFLYGNFNDNSYVYDTKKGGKSTVTLEHYTSIDYGDVFAFVDYAIADSRFKYHDDKTDFYGEIHPRLNLSKVTSTDLSFSFVKQVYLAYEYNVGEDYVANLMGFGTDLDIPGFQFFGLNVFRKFQNIGDDTYQLSPYYRTKVIGNIFHINGFTDWTEYDFLSQNQFLFDMNVPFNIKNLYVGFEWHYYNQKAVKANFNTKINSNTLQAMIKYSW